MPEPYFGKGRLKTVMAYVALGFGIFGLVGTIVILVTTIVTGVPIVGVLAIIPGLFMTVGGYRSWQAQRRRR